MESTAEHGSRIEDAELLWRYHEAPGDLGLRAIALEPSIRGDISRHPSPKQLSAADLARRVDTALDALDASSREILKAAHRPIASWERNRFPDLAEMAPVVIAIHGEARILTFAIDVSRARSKDESKPVYHEARRLARQALIDLRRAAEDRVSKEIRRYRSERRRQDALREAQRRYRRHSNRETEFRALGLAHLLESPCPA